MSFKRRLKRSQESTNVVIRNVVWRTFSLVLLKLEMCRVGKLEGWARAHRVKLEMKFWAKRFDVTLIRRHSISGHVTFQNCHLQIKRNNINRGDPEIFMVPLLLIGRRMSSYLLSSGVICGVTNPGALSGPPISLSVPVDRLKNPAIHSILALQHHGWPFITPPPVGPRYKRSISLSKLLNF